MRTINVWACVVLALTTGVNAPADDTAAELSPGLKALQGTWTHTTPGGLETTFVIEKDKLKATLPIGNYVATISVDENAKPNMTIDFKITEGPDEAKDQMTQGIYKLAGDTLEMCVNADSGSSRPVEFKLEEGTTLLFKLAKKK